MFIQIIRQMIYLEAFLFEVTGDIVGNGSDEFLGGVDLSVVRVYFEVGRELVEGGVYLSLTFVKISHKNVMIEFVLFEQES